PGVPARGVSFKVPCATASRSPRSSCSRLPAALIRRRAHRTRTRAARRPAEPKQATAAMAPAAAARTRVTGDAAPVEIRRAVDARRAAVVPRRPRVHLEVADGARAGAVPAAEAQVAPRAEVLTTIRAGRATPTRPPLT